MIDPDVVRVGKRDGITSPDIFRIEVSNLDVLDDDVGNTSHSQTLSVEDRVGTSADQCLVRSYIDSLVGGKIDGRRVGWFRSASTQSIEQTLSAIRWGTA